MIDFNHFAVTVARPCINNDTCCYSDDICAILTGKIDTIMPRFTPGNRIIAITKP